MKLFKVIASMTYAWSWEITLNSFSVKNKKKTPKNRLFYTEL